MYYISMDGRYYYEAGTNEVTDPAALRGRNEFLHRIADFQLSILKQKESHTPDETFFELFYGMMQELHINTEWIVDAIHEWIPPAQLLH